MSISQDPSSDYHDLDRDNGAPRGRVNMRDFQVSTDSFQLAQNQFIIFFWKNNYVLY